METCHFGVFDKFFNLKNYILCEPIYHSYHSKVHYDYLLLITPHGNLVLYLKYSNSEQKKEKQTKKTNDI